MHLATAYPNVYNHTQGVIYVPRGKLPDDEKCIKISISFQPDQLEQLQQYCQKEERSMSWVIRKALADWLPKHEAHE